MTSTSLPGMGPLPGGPLSRRHAPAATLPGAGRHNRVSWAGITLPSSARPGPGGGPWRLRAGETGPREGGRGWARRRCSACLGHVLARRPHPTMTGLDPHPYPPQGSALPYDFPA